MGPIRGCKWVVMLYSSRGGGGCIPSRSWSPEVFARPLEARALATSRVAERRVTRALRLRYAPRCSRAMSALPIRMLHVSLRTFVLVSHLFRSLRRAPASFAAVWGGVGGVPIRRRDPGATDSPFRG